MAGDFAARIDELKERVGEGVLKGQCKRDQVYAHYQEVRLDLHHPNGGQARYQEQTLLDNAGKYWQSVGETILDGGGPAAMIEATEEFCNDSGGACPKELTLLAHSDHPTVTDNGAVIYDRPPEVPRLSEAELRSLARLRPSQQRPHGYANGGGRHGAHL